MTRIGASSFARCVARNDTAPFVTPSPAPRRREPASTRRCGQAANSKEPVGGIVLADGPMRFTALETRIEGITPKALTETLRALEQDGLVVRTEHAGNPPRVGHALTPLGRSPQEPPSAVRDWAASHVPQILAARAHRRPLG